MRDAGTDAEQARGRVIRQVLSADTRHEIEMAWRTLQEWMAAHPADQAMRDGFEQMSLILDAIEQEEKQYSPEGSTSASAGEAA